MFKKNTKHLQGDFFGFRNFLPTQQQQLLDESEESKFYELIFCNIQEEDFACLYSDVDSRPNSPINAMVSALIIMQKKSYTYEELFKNIHFNLLTKTALGLHQIDEVPFCPATLFNFQKGILTHLIRTGENLLERVFDTLTVEQIKELKLKTNIQRTDSFFAASNIRNYTRLQLLVEMLIRFARILDKEDAAYFTELLHPYIKNTSERYIYHLKASDIPHHLEKIGDVYFRLSEHLQTKYAAHPVFQAFQRVYREHFKVTHKRIIIKEPEELTSDSMQSPDDLEATFCNKNGKKSKGQLINIFETAHPDNQVNLLTDVSVRANNVHDTTILNDRIDNVKDKTPDIEELHFDAQYGSSQNDKKLHDLHITPVQTALKGKTARVDIRIEECQGDRYIVRCPQQRVLSQLRRKRHAAHFNHRICAACFLASVCPAIHIKQSRVYYFTQDDYLQKKRLHSLRSIPPERRKLRNNVEASVAEFVRKMPNKKLKIRGYFKTTVFAFTAAIAINFGRIFRCLHDLDEKSMQSAAILAHFFKKSFLQHSRILLAWCVNHFTNKSTIYQTFCI